ncbi:MAG: HipA N-terminal domain-containing protein [Lachnospiraceae bacterium]|nr:HipA N-terminal domain-containing protein [Lachnospiraceae bacterium]
MERKSDDGRRLAYVYVQNRYAGLLAQTDEGYAFDYDTEYLSSGHALAVSLTLPLRAETYFSRTLFPFFDGLIPEGWLLEVVRKNWKLDSKDRFGLLLAACRDSIGDVSIRGERDA